MTCDGNRNLVQAQKGPGVTSAGAFYLAIWRGGLDVVFEPTGNFCV